MATPPTCSQAAPLPVSSFQAKFRMGDGTTLKHFYAAGVIRANAQDTPWREPLNMLVSFKYGPD